MTNEVSFESDIDFIRIIAPAAMCWLLPYLIVILVIAGVFFVIWKIEQHRIRTDALSQKRGICPDCNYDLRSRFSNRCPEYGRMLDGPESSPT